MTEFPAPINLMLIRSVEEFFRSNNFDDVTCEESGSLELADCDYFSVISFSGEKIKGTLMIGTGDKVLEETHPNKAMGMEVEEIDKGDWIGEISNQILGRFKNLILNSGVDFALTTPSVLKGVRISTFELKSDQVRQQIRFKTLGEDFHLDINIQILEEIDFSAETLDEEKSEEEGSSLFF